MRKILPLVLLSFLLGCADQSSNENTFTAKASGAAESADRPEYTIAIHGGAGSVEPGWFTAEEEQARRDALEAALKIGEEVLNGGGSSVDAVVKTIQYLEESTYFNAGKGAVFTYEGVNELDASIMDGKSEKAGAVGGVKTVKSPIEAARAVMEQSPHVFLTGKGAEVFAEEKGLEMVDNNYFFTEKNYQRLQEVQAKEDKKSGWLDQHFPDRKFGTVGCVALDKNGNLAAGTSTGGMTNKRWNRIGDSPVIGAGTYAENNSCAVSCTGHGEYFIRYAVAYDLSVRMRYLGEDLETAANYIINEHLKEKGGNGGLVALDKNGNVTFPFNTNGMFRGYAKPGELKVGMYKNEPWDNQE